MSHNSGGNRLMSIHSMLGSNNNNQSNDSKRLPEDPRHSNMPTNHAPQTLSPRQHNPGYRASNVHPHDPARFFAPPQPQEPHYPQHQQQPYGHQQHNRMPSNGHLAAHGPHSQFHMHNHANMQHPPYSTMAAHERERERERERDREREYEREREREREEQIRRDRLREDDRERERERIREREREKERDRERQREKRERDRERERERERQEGARTPGGRYESARSTPHAHLPTHHHHHVHHSPVPFKKPKLTIVSSQVFEEAKKYPDAKLGRWTYDPTRRQPFLLRVNATFVVHIPRYFLDPQHNSALRDRKVWGTEIYTDDSDLAAVLIHSTSRMPPLGDLEMVVRVMPRLLKYKSSMTNDLRSRGWLTKHDGLSIYVEQVNSVPWIKERQGKGFIKRAVAENLFHDTTMADAPMVSVDWPPRKLTKRASEEMDGDIVSQVEQQAAPPQAVDTSKDNEKPVDENGGDDTIELSMNDDNTEAESSFATVPRGSLISNAPEVLPTSIAHNYVGRDILEDNSERHNESRTEDEAAPRQSSAGTLLGQEDTTAAMPAQSQAQTNPSSDEIERDAPREEAPTEDLSTTDKMQTANSPVHEIDAATQPVLDNEARSVTLAPPDSVMPDALPELPQMDTSDVPASTDPNTSAEAVPNNDISMPEDTDGDIPVLTTEEKALLQASVATEPVEPAEPSTAEPSTAEPSTAEPSTAEINTLEPSTAEPNTSSS